MSTLAVRYPFRVHDGDEELLYATGAAEYVRERAIDTLWKSFIQDYRELK